MGYSYATFDWLDRLDLPRGGEVLDLGSQDLYLNSDPELDRVNSFIAKRGGRPIKSSPYPFHLPTEAIWTRAGFSYRCIDIDDRPGTINVDLQALRFPPRLKNSFDLVMNAGTTEHLANPVGGFAFMHFACREGGIMAHDVPMSGYSNHALVNPTPKFWTLLRTLNRYETLSASVRRSPEPPGCDTYCNDEFGYIEGLSEACDLSWMISIAFRKQHAAAFTPPLDPAAGVPHQTIVDLILGSLRPFDGAWTRREMLDAIDGAMAARYFRGGAFGFLRRLARGKALGD